MRIHAGQFAMPLLVVLIFAANFPAQASWEGTWETDYKFRLGASTEGALGELDEVAEGFVDFQPVFRWRGEESLSVFGRGQALAPSGPLLGGDEDTPDTDESFLRLRELWVDYSGLTSYPGESIRLGLQRLQHPDGLWFDRDIESVRWIFDTTLLQAEIGMAESLSSWRTDVDDPPADLRDRFYAFGGISGQWNPGHFFGSRAALATDHGDPEEEILSGVSDPKLTERQFTWLEFYGHNGYFGPPKQPGWSYWGNLSLLNGWREDYSLIETVPDPASDPVSAPLFDTVVSNRESVFGWAVDAGLRWTLPGDTPWQFGVAYAYASGGHSGEVVDGYEQTGLQSNRSRFTGTRSSFYRYNEALRADLNNLRVATAYVSLPSERFDVSLVYHHFVRNRDEKPVATAGLNVQPEVGGDQLGQGLDFVAAYYFGAYIPTLAREDENLRSSVNLRASVFQPGSAYDDSVDDQFRVALEMTLWF